MTSEPELFCTELVDTEGATMTAGDEIVLEVTGDQPGVVDIERIRVAYRDRVQWATQFAGSPAVRRPDPQSLMRFSSASARSAASVSCSPSMASVRWNHASASASRPAASSVSA